MLPEKQKRFIEFYLQTANATAAAKEAGYSKKTAYSIGQRLLRDPNVKKVLERRLKNLEDKRIAKTNEILERLTSTLRGEESEIIVTQSGKRFEVPPRISDRIKAAEILLKVSGAFSPEKVNVQMSGAELFTATLEKVWANCEKEQAR